MVLKSLRDTGMKAHSA